MQRPAFTRTLYGDMQGDTASAVGSADELRSTAEELARLAGTTEGFWTLEVRIEDGKFKNIRRHHGPLHSNEDLEALGRAVGVITD